MVRNFDEKKRHKFSIFYKRNEMNFVLYFGLLFTNAILVLEPVHEWDLT